MIFMPIWNPKWLLPSDEKHSLFFLWNIRTRRKKVTFIFNIFRLGQENITMIWFIFDTSNLRKTKQDNKNVPGHRGRNRITTYAISAYHRTLRVQTPLGRDVLETTLCDKVCQWLAADLWFSLGTPVSSSNKTATI